MGLRGRPSKSGKRKNGRLIERTVRRDYGNDRVQARRELFHGVRKNAEGKPVDVSDQIYDAPGQLHALGFFDDHGHEPALIRDTIRDYGFGYWNRHSDKSPKCGQYERSSFGRDPLMDSRADISFERMTRALDGMRFERRCLEALVCDCWWTDELPPFALCLIHEALLRKGRKPSAPIELPGLNDREMLAGALRAAFRLIETGLQIHTARRAA
jgi:hypothetical protein